MDVIFPSDGGIKGLVYWLISNIMDWGWVSYGFAIIFMTLFIKLMMSPVDFLNRFLSRKNQLKMQELAPEEADLKKIYANDPMAFARAKQDLYRKNGAGGLGASLVMLGSLILTMVVFFNVMGALTDISKVNIYNQYEKMDAVYQQYKDGDAETLKTELNKTYNETKMPFLWVKNIWRADTFWTSPIMSFEEFNSNLSKDKKLPAEKKEEYNAIYANISAENKSGNGWLILIVLAGLTSWASAKLSTVITAKLSPKKEKKVGTKEEPIITYSLRDAKTQSAPTTPTVDPAQVNKILQIVMPAMIVIFTINQTSAFAIYTIASSVITTFFTIGFSFLVDFIIKKQKPKKRETEKFDATVINPHAKYFKGGKK